MVINYLQQVNKVFNNLLHIFTVLNIRITVLFGTYSKQIKLMKYE